MRLTEITAAAIVVTITNMRPEMKAREFHALLANLTGATLGEIDQRTRYLRDHDLIATGPRGLGAPDLKPIEAALMLLSLVSRRAADAGPIMARAMDLTAIVPPDLREWPLEDTTALATVLMAGLSRAETMFDRIEIMADGSMAWVDFALSDFRRRVLFTDEERVRSWVAEFPDTYDSQGVTVLGHRLVITGAVVAQIALELADDGEAGYALAKAG